MRWIRKKYRRVKTFAKAHEAWKTNHARSTPRSFAHWQWIHRHSGEKGEKSPVTRECHAGILREPGGEFPRPPDRGVRVS